MVITNNTPDKYTNTKSIVLETNGIVLSEKGMPQYIEMGLPCSIVPPTTDVPAQHSDIGGDTDMVIIII